MKRNENMRNANKRNDAGKKKKRKGVRQSLSDRERSKSRWRMKH